MAKYRDDRSPAARRFILGAAAFGMLALATGSYAAQSPEPVMAGNADPSTLCEDAAIHHEHMNGLPRALLAAVAMAESGRYDRTTRKARAWPWTINAEGRAYYFKTKAEAVATTRRLLATGMRSIDVGCMQVNLRYHPDAFASLEDGFDPMTNVAYGADFLMRLHDRSGSWPEAVANYHSQTEARGDRYFARVIRIWRNERERVVNRTVAALQPKIDLTGVPETRHRPWRRSRSRTGRDDRRYRISPGAQGARHDTGTERARNGERGRRPQTFDRRRRCRNGNRGDRQTGTACARAAACFGQPDTCRRSVTARRVGSSD